MEKDYTNIATKIMLRAVFIGLALWFLYLVRDVVALFFFSVIFAATLDPVIYRMNRKGISRPFAVSIIYVLLLITLIIFISILIPPLMSQLNDFTQKLPQYSETFSHILGGLGQYTKSYGIEFNPEDFIKNSLGNFSNSSSQIFSTTVGVFQFFISAIVVLALTFYMAVKEDGMKKFLLSITPQKHHEYVTSLSERIKAKIGRWMFGQLLLMVIIFFLDFIALSIFKIPYSLILAIFAGLLEIVPYLGPIVSTVLASLIGFLISPFTGFLVLIILTLIQQLESHVIAPQLMKKVVGLNPIAVILALLAGFKLGGPIGAILAIPLATAISVFVMDMLHSKEKMQ